MHVSLYVNVLGFVCVWDGGGGGVRAFALVVSVCTYLCVCVPVHELVCVSSCMRTHACVHACGCLCERLQV